MADQYDQNSKQGRVEFDKDIQREIIVLSYDICEREGWKLEAAGHDLTHSHQVISWNGFVKWEWVDQRLKNLLALKLNQRHKTPRKRWFARRHGAPRRVRDRKHLNRLLDKYFPDHPGVFWKRGMPLPEIDAK